MDAGTYQGMGIYDTEEKIRNQVDNERIRVLSIGLAGENRVLYSCLGNDYSRNIGRGGFGAVFGSKNLKFIALRGIADITADNSREFVKATLKTMKWIRNNPWVAGSRQHGTAGNVQAMNDLGALPAWNFSGEQFEGASKINHEVLEKKLIRRLSCANCTISCSKGTRDTQYTGGEVEGPEFETLALLGSNIGLDEPDGIGALNYLCNQFGMDTITTGSVAGLVFDALRRHKVNKEMFGFTEDMTLAQRGMHLITLIAERKGIGEILAEGSKKTAELLGIAGEAPQVKGLDFAGYDPRASAGMSLAYQTSDRGACHLRSFPLGRENSGALKPGNMTEGKAEFVSNQQNAKAAEECLGICQFPYGIGINDACIAEMASAFIDREVSVSDLELIGERIWNVSRIFNHACGMDRKDDYLPDRISESTMQYGPTKGWGVTRRMQDQMLDEYYRLRGWENSGIPTQEMLEKLDIVDEAKMIRERGER
jgi:aldehyde:ferredoxin oxidoreductase